MQLLDIIKVGLSYYFCSVRMSEGYKVSILIDSINHYQNNFFPLRHWQTLNEIYGDVQPYLLWNGERLE